MTPRSFGSAQAGLDAAGLDAAGTRRCRLHLLRRTTGVFQERIDDRFVIVHLGAMSGMAKPVLPHSCIARIACSADVSVGVTDRCGCPGAKSIWCLKDSVNSRTNGGQPLQVAPGIENRGLHVRYRTGSSRFLVGGE